MLKNTTRLIFAKHCLMLFNLCHTSKLCKTVAKLSAERHDQLKKPAIKVFVVNRFNWINKTSLSYKLF